MKKVLIIDGNSLFFSSYYATANNTKRTLSAGETPTNAIFVLANTLINMLDLDFSHVIVALDSEVKTFRHALYPEYKGTRSAPPDDLILQFPLADELYSLLNYHPRFINGYEADDIIGTVAKLAENAGFEVVIYSRDRDLLQLISTKTKIHMKKKELEIYDLNKLKEEWSLTPTQIIDYKALVGDASDNIKGVKGIGEKKGKELLNLYNDLDNIYANVDKLSPKVKQLLIEQKDSAYLSKFLATIKLDVPLDFALDDLSFISINKTKLIEYFKRYNMNSLLNKVSSLKSEEKTIEKYDFSFTKTLKKVDKFEYGGELETLPIIFDYQGDYLDNKLSGIYYLIKEICYYQSIDSVLNDDRLLSVLKSDVKKIVISNKECQVQSKLSNIILNNVSYDLSIMAYLLGNINTKQNHINLEVYHISSDSLESIYYLDRVYKMLYDELKDRDLLNLYHEIELPLTTVLASIELQGVTVSTAILNQLKINYERKVSELEKSIYILAESEFNINSPKQLSEILFDKLKLNNPSKGSTDNEVLNSLINDHKVINEIINYRKYSKLLNTYINGYLPYIKDDKIHSKYTQTLTSTGRLSSIEPNMQNIATRDIDQKNIKKAYVASPNKVLISYDYSQIELRVLAYLAKDQNMLDAFNNGEDIHTRTASLIFNVPYDEVTKEMRSNSKAINFGIVYGIKAFSLAKQINIAYTDAKRFIDKYYERFPKIKEYLDGAVASASSLGYVTTMYKRRREIKELYSPDRHLFEFGKRLAYNTPIQGSAADIMKIAMINVSNYLKSLEYHADIIAQIHDEIIIEVDRDHVHDLKDKVKEIMESVNDEIDLKVEYQIGDSWYDLS